MYHPNVGLGDFMNYGQRPLGSLPGEEHLRAPYNGTSQHCVVRVRNLSGERTRKVIREAISLRRGGEASVNNKRFKGELNVSVEALRYRASQGEDMNWYEDKVAPEVFTFRFDGVRYSVPPFDPKTKAPAPWVIIPDGAWDLFKGNYQRMNSGDQQERARELVRVRGAGYCRFDIDDPSERGMGFLEFSREEVVPQQFQLDAEQLVGVGFMEV